MKKSYKLVDLDCANCALKMERAISQLPGVETASVNFLAQRMIIDFSENADIPQIMKSVVKCIHKVEPDCEVIL